MGAMGWVQSKLPVPHDWYCFFGCCVATWWADPAICVGHLLVAAVHLS